MYELKYFKICGGHRTSYCDECRKENARKNNKKIQKLKNQRLW
mgnify:CR=1 FL=1